MTERHPIADEVEKFLAEYCRTRNALDTAVYSGFAARLLDRGMQPFAETVELIRRWMAEVREEDVAQMRDASSIMRRGGGYIAMTPSGEIIEKPRALTLARARRMIVVGLLVPTGDSLLDEVPSQTYKLSSIAP